MTGRLETFLVRPTDGAPKDATERIAEHAALLGGIVLMATPGGSLVVALTRQARDVLASNSLVDLIGGVTLNDDAPGATALRQRFARNAERQIGRLATPPPRAPDQVPRRPG